MGGGGQDALQSLGDRVHRDTIVIGYDGLREAKYRLDNDYNRFFLHTVDVSLQEQASAVIYLTIRIIAGNKLAQLERLIKPSLYSPLHGDQDRGKRPMLNERWTSIRRLCDEHRREILAEAKRYRYKGISADYFSSVMKATWEKDLYRKIRDLLGRDVALLGKDAGWVGDVRAKRVLIVDVFDGSVNFFFWLGPYTYNVSLADEGELTFGLSIDIEGSFTYYAIRGEGAYFGKMRAPGPAEELGRIACSNISLFDTKFVHWGCSSLELCSLASGQVDLVVRASKLEDVAAALLIASESRASMRSWELQPISFRIRRNETLQYIGGREPSILRFVRTIGGGGTTKAKDRRDAIGLVEDGLKTELSEISTGVKSAGQVGASGVFGFEGRRPTTR